jgi:hypothetical protein
VECVQPSGAFARGARQPASETDELNRELLEMGGMDHRLLAIVNWHAPYPGGIAALEIGNWQSRPFFCPEIFLPKSAVR